MDGILNIDKPAGITSFGVVALVRRLTGEKHVGHGGTLDPAATGVLPVCLGRGTKVIEYLMDTTKTYRAQVKLGIATDTYDGSGEITQRGDPSGVTLPQLETTLASFHGSIRQTPPMYSAIKHHGQPLYKLARAGIEVERPSRPVKVHRLEIIAWQPPVVTLEIECSKGTYIRSLAHDLGIALGCGAFLQGLVRTRCGVFTLEDAVQVPRLEEVCQRGYWPHFLYGIDTVLEHHSAIIVDQAAEDKIKKGSSLTLGYLGRSAEEGPAGQHLCRAYTSDGRFLGMLHQRPEKGLWHPRKVMYAGGLRPGP